MLPGNSRCSVKGTASCSLLQTGRGGILTQEGAGGGLTPSSVPEDITVLS